VLKNVLAISGSIRESSSNEVLLLYIKEKYKEEFNVTIYNGLNLLPHFNPDLDKGQVPPAVVDLRVLIQQADGVIICSPEYVFSLPGALKNAIEWTVSTTVFSEKPVALIVASGLGEKAFEALVLIMTTLYAHVQPSSNLLIRGARAKVASGGLTDPTTIGEIDAVMTSFRAAMNNSK
ncbi:MAG TPA: NADPH-dependent FMN reductase, partial [Chitinophagaceae bacterium]|nr:NADPH-dependent FMN reductase [Chitinophagaceae bacterium]